MAYLKKTPLSYDEIFEMIDYDPINGTFTWKKPPSKRIKAGSPCGTFKGVRKSVKTGLETRYLYIHVKYYDVPGARIAWILSYGKWPEGNVLFRDGNSENLKLENLYEAQFTRVHSDPKTNKIIHKSTPEAQRNYVLKRYNGMTLKEYNVKLEAQNHVCAICHGPEVAIIHGKLKPLSVDHNHKTGAIRDLLCSHCNHMIGHASERIEVLQSAIKYLEKHSDCDKDQQNEGTS